MNKPNKIRLRCQFIVLITIIRNHEMLNQVQHDKGSEFSVTLNLFQGLMNTDTSVFDYGLWLITTHLHPPIR